MTEEHEITIDLSLLETVRFYSTPNGSTLSLNNTASDSPCVFILEFRDGRTIAFRLDDNSDSACDSFAIESQRNEWIDSLEESHFILTKNPIPVWMK